MDTARAVIDQTARAAYGRLVAFLSARTRDIAAAEDALATAFLKALEDWPRQGVPSNPDAWLLTVARNRLHDEYRRARVRSAAEPTLALLFDAVAEAAFPDERLKLMFVCAHPAIDSTIHTPLMLQTVLGLSAERIASAYLVKPAMMGQRLSRAKAKIRDAAIAFEVPEPAEWAGRLPPLLAAIYAGYLTGWNEVPGEGGQTLMAEALELGNTLMQLVPTEPELKGLMALMLCSAARRPARMRDGAFVPLDQQDTASWDWSLANRARDLLDRVASMKRPGRYQLEAAIQAVHMERASSGRTDWPRIADLYARLLAVAPSLGAGINHAVALAECGQPEAGLTALDSLDAARVASYQPYWAARAHLLTLTSQRDAAFEAYTVAMGLSRDDAQRAFLMARRKAL